MQQVDETGSARKWGGGGDTGDDDSDQVPAPAIKARDLFGRLVNLSWPEDAFFVSDKKHDAYVILVGGGTAVE
jgi:hypothetical protein|eukprot:evm.model.NODE_18784_length_12911_cov_19.438231.5